MIQNENKSFNIGKLVKEQRIISQDKYLHKSKQGPKTPGNKSVQKKDDI